MQHSNVRNTFITLAALAALSSAGDVAAQSVDIGGQTCSNNYSLYDYYSNGEYVGSAWEVDGVNCTPGSGGDYGYGDGTGVYPGGGGGAAAATCQSTDPATVEGYADALSVDAASSIRSRSDYRNREYGALIYRDAGGAIRLTPLVPGTAVSVSFDFAALGVNPASIVGIVHNHPYNVYRTSTQELQINLNPSVNDWNAAASIVGAGANADILQLYVVGTDGVLREFDYNNRTAYEPRRTTSGYGVTPGARVPTTLVASPCP